GDDSYRGLIFSRDGYSIYYLAQKEQQPTSLYQISVLGGGLPRKLLDDLSTPIALSPDGAHLAFLRGSENGADLLTANADGSGLRVLARSAGQTVFATFKNNNDPAWSPDARIIACPIMTNTEPLQMSITAIQVADRSTQPIGSRKWYLIGQIAWVSDGSGLIMDAQEKMPPASTSQIWQLSYPNGDARSLTNGLNYHRGTSVTADATTLVTTRSVRVSNMLMVSGFPTSQVNEMPARKNKGWAGLTWTSEGNHVSS